MGVTVKVLEVQADDVPSLSLIHSLGNPVKEGDQVVQAGHAYHKPLLMEPDPLVVLYVLYDGTQNDLLHNPPQH